MGPFNHPPYMGPAGEDDDTGGRSSPPAPIESQSPVHGDAHLLVRSRHGRRTLYYSLIHRSAFPRVVLWDEAGYSEVEVLPTGPDNQH